MKMFAVLLAISAMCACALAQMESPAICQLVECPTYTVLDEFPMYELRSYPSAMFAKATAPVSNDRWLETSRALYGRLHTYISGANEAGTTIAMTAPLFSEFMPTSSLSSHDQMSMYIYLGTDHQLSPPVPSSLDVEIVELESREYYVRRFGRYRGKDELLSEINSLGASIINQASFDSNYVVKVAYNFPGQATGPIINEVWLKKLM